MGNSPTTENELRAELRIRYRVWSGLRDETTDARHKFVVTVQRLLNAGWSQAMVAAELDISRQAISRLLKENP